MTAASLGVHTLSHEKLSSRKAPRMWSLVSLGQKSAEPPKVAIFWTAHAVPGKSLPGISRHYENPKVQQLQLLVAQRNRARKLPSTHKLRANMHGRPLHAQNCAFCAKIPCTVHCQSHKLCANWVLSAHIAIVILYAQMYLLSYSAVSRKRPVESLLRVASCCRVFLETSNCC